MASHTALDAWQETHGASSAARWEFEQVIAEAKENGPIEVVLEIGTHAGASLAIWIEEFKPVCALGLEVEFSERTLAGIRPLVKEHPCAVVMFGDSTNTATWNAVAAFLRGTPVDFLYIDGDHSGLVPSTDLALYGSLVRPGGVIVLDDTKREPSVQHVMQSRPDGSVIEGPGVSTGKYLLVKPD